jgi:hypothetical protein
MVIRTLDQLIAGFQPPQFFHKTLTAAMVSGRPQSFWAPGGVPGPGAFDNTLNGVVLDSSGGLVAGQIPFYDAPGSEISHLARFAATHTGAGGRVLLCDRLWHNGGYTITSTSAQNSVTPDWPARDADGAIAGKGVLLGVEVSTQCGAAAPILTANYTNSDGVAGRSGTNTFATANSPTAGAFFPLNLQGNDAGVQSVESLTLSASWISGVINLVAYRVLGEATLLGAGQAHLINPITGGLPPMYNGSVPFVLLYPTATTAGYLSGQMTVAQG